VPWAESLGVNGMTHRLPCCKLMLCGDSPEESATVARSQVQLSGGAGTMLADLLSLLAWTVGV
jgi:hypothetical protein